MTREDQEPTKSRVHQEARAPGTDREQRPQIPRIDSATLFNGGQRVLIHHRGEDYQLRATRQGKLILTK
ncbi:hemin uptake protein HemP [Halorhodospira halophila]|uniref:Hemin uptake protein HemP n=1 Tax=Halorhodospira halophila (strain DSM 244 / SL1) TaxID=349124 RepID=A1WU18_HALHL|nr:hemin uptake protein HemP [Halorhodospira halophila]ABM61180.1 hypothetical protein Hhal_0386 [Halorhodospira halophila SL1]MBK1729627.1 hemin uptake protein HemP [Halorhodospira halophila]